MNMLLVTIADVNTGEDALVTAILSLGDIEENTKFWSAIANNPAYSDQHRRYAVFMLLKRHLHAPTPLVELIEKLDKPTWIRNEEIMAVKQLGGNIPVRFDAANTVFVLPILKAHRDTLHSSWAIYLKIEGQITLSIFQEMLRGIIKKEKFLNKQVLEIAISPETI